MINNFAFLKKTLLQIVIEDVPHKFQERLIDFLNTNNECYEYGRTIDMLRHPTKP